jgi:Bacterial PH domain
MMQRSFRRSGARWWLTACVSGFFLIGLSGVLASTDGEHANPIAARLFFFAPIAMLSAWVMVGVARQGIFCDERGVTVRNVFRRYEMAWSEIETIEPPVRYGALRNAGIGFRLRGGRHVNAALYSAGPLNRRGFADDTLSVLREELARHAGHSGEETAQSAEGRQRDAARTSARFWLRYRQVGVGLAGALAIVGIVTRDWTLIGLGLFFVAVGLGQTLILRRFGKGMAPGGPPTTP